MYPNMLSMASMARVLLTAFFLLNCMHGTNARLLRDPEKDGAYEIVEKARTQTQTRLPATPVLEGNYIFVYSPTHHEALLKEKQMQGSYITASSDKYGSDIDIADYHPPRKPPPHGNV